MEKVPENPMKLPGQKIMLEKMNWDRKKEKVKRKIWCAQVLYGKMNKISRS